MNKWIKVTEKLPKHEALVLCCEFGYLPHVALFHKNRDYLFLDPNCMRIQFKNVTHWMELPKNPSLQD